ncbi:GrpB family protein [Deinococcus yavapaiensis]|uniref:GrpB-like predicted nucleotidyltransferase (UPF0157 family) n=1 Tax=Deinococcus yavapaiensis KR-236 TaxID=694435 RepID=A0A318SBR5_9DEIO|nr:GrpB family protein [Deinococcus yavapaiensis]PYE54187.1 GrpB-like predicted nucleotidyltransferase (UPF0157 family) [Deinococcus yavapaiensis KR-236]
MKIIVIEPYRDGWPQEFQEIGAEIRGAVGDFALAVHHIGSTSVPGLAAKDVIDVQLTVGDLNAPIREALENAGYRFRDGVFEDHCPPGMTIDPWDLEKRYYSRDDRKIHLHVRERGRYNQRYALLCRDYLRFSAMARDAYAEVKRQLARLFPDDVAAYYAVKDPVFDVLMSGAFVWAETTGWKEPESDA